MPEVYVELKLRLPKAGASAMAKVLDSANPQAGNDAFAHYGGLGEGVETMLRERARGEPDWVDEQLTVDEQLSPQGFDHRGRLAKIQYMTGDIETGEALADMLTALFEKAGIEVAGADVYSEHDLEDMADDEDDEDDEFDGLEV